MAIHPYNYSSGSISQDKSVLDYTLHPHDYQEDCASQKLPVTSSLTANTEVKTVNLWRDAAVDLNRLGTLLINGKSCYSVKDAHSETSTVSSVSTDKQEKTDKQETDKQEITELVVTEQTKLAGKVFTSLLDSTEIKGESNLAIALSLSHLCCQSLSADPLQKVLEEKGSLIPIAKKTDEDKNSLDRYNPNPDHHVQTKEKIIAVEINQKDVSISHELLEEHIDFQKNVSTFFKIKVKVEGTREAFEKRDIKKLTLKVAYTKDYFTEEGAIKADYFGTRAGSFGNSKSYFADLYTKK